MTNDNLEVALTKSVCPACGKTFDDALVLNTRLTPAHADKVRELQGKVIDLRPCSACKDMLDDDMICLIEIAPPFPEPLANGNFNPSEVNRTGRMFWVKRHAAQHCINTEIRDIMFIDQETADILFPDAPEKEPCDDSLSSS
jgi:hypothetical protein